MDSDAEHVGERLRTLRLFAVEPRCAINDPHHALRIPARLLVVERADTGRVGLEEVMTMWQPIATAPKDGTVFIAYSEDIRVPEESNRLPPFVSLCSWHPDAGFCTCEIRDPTFWMPFVTPHGGSDG